MSTLGVEGEEREEGRREQSRKGFRHFAMPFTRHTQLTNSHGSKGNEADVVYQGAYYVC